MKTFNDIEKIYSGISADSRIKEQLLEKHADNEQIKGELFYGYKMNSQNQLVIDEIPAENVRFIYRKIYEYDKNPPDALVLRIIEKYKLKSTILTFEEAKPLVGFSDIQEYIAEELSIKNMSFDLTDNCQSVETLRKILAQPFDDFPVDDIRKNYQAKIQSADSVSSCKWLKRVQRISRNPMYKGTSIQRKKFVSHSTRKQCTLDHKDFTMHHEALISNEHFEQLNNVLKKAKRKN